ncbi:MAG: cation:proton antiporter [bacterium]|nr:cation:proton antiporter [bacterium]
MGTLILKDILIIFLISIPVVLVLRKFHLPPLLGFLATGAIIGPHGIGFITDKAQIDILAELGVTLLLFSVGLEFSFDALERVRRPGIISAILQITLTILAGVVIGFLNWGSLYKGLFFGCIIALSSTAVVFTTLSHFKLLDSVSGRLTTVILIFQDLALIPMMVLLPWAATLTGGESIFQQLVWQIGKAFFLVASVALIAQYFADPLFRLISKGRSRELFVITTIVIGLGMAWLTHSLGLSFALGAFLGGIMIGATEYQYQALSEIKPFRFCFNSLFFVSIGMLLNFAFLREHYQIVLLLIFLIPFLKFLITSFSVLVAGLPLRLAFLIGISLGQIGEFSFLLAYMGQRTGAISPFLYQLIIAIAVVAMVITPPLIQKAPQIADWLASLPIIRKFSFRAQDHHMKETSKRLQGHVVICGFGPLGQTFGKLLAQHEIPYMVLELNPETIKRVRETDRQAFYGDGASEEILYESGLERARLLAITVPDFLNAAAIIQQARRVNPNIQIITRAKYRNQVDKLYHAGADVVISEELEGGLEMGRYALKLLGVEKETVDGFLHKVRDFGSADFF